MQRKSLYIAGASGVAVAAVSAALVISPDSSGPVKISAPPVSEPSTTTHTHKAKPYLATPTPSHSGSRQTGDDPAPVSDPEAVALARTMKISTKQARQRLDQQETNALKADSIDTRLGGAGAGSWLDPTTGAVQTNVLTAQAASTVKADGSTPHMVTRSTAELAAIQARLDKVANPPEGAVWGVDVINDRLSVAVTPNTTDAALASFLAAAELTDVQQSALAVRHDAQPLTVAASLTGGDAVDMATKKGGKANGSCSAGFLAKNPKKKTVVITAGHCSLLGKYYSRASNGKAIGHMLRFQFGWRKKYSGDKHGDWSVVSVDHPAQWTPTGGVVDKHKATFTGVKVKGAKVAPIGAWVCKSGETSYWTCGRVTGRNWSGQVGYVTANGGQFFLTLKGMTASTICTQDGDSGGAVMWNNQAQGMVSAGNDCNPKKPKSTDMSIFQPLQRVLNAAHLKLLKK